MNTASRLISIPFAGIVQIKYLGCNLRLQAATPVEINNQNSIILMPRFLMQKTASERWKCDKNPRSVLHQAALFPLLKFIKSSGNFLVGKVMEVFVCLAHCIEIIRLLDNHYIISK